MVSPELSSLQIRNITKRSSSERRRATPASLSVSDVVDTDCEPSFALMMLYSVTDDLHQKDAAMSSCVVIVLKAREAGARATLPCVFMTQLSRTDLCIAVP